MKRTIFDNQGHADSTFLYIWTGSQMGFAPGSFATSLIQAFINADGDNQERLGSVYPCYAEAWRKCKSGELERDWRQRTENHGDTTG